MARLFGTDGVRGIANEFLSCERAMQIGRALGSVLSSNNKYHPTVLIGMDTRLKDIISRENRNILYGFLTAQTFNICFTLLIAWLLFGVVKPMIA